MKKLPTFSLRFSREKTIKGWVRAKKLALIESVNPTWKDLSAIFYNTE